MSFRRVIVFLMVLTLAGCGYTLRQAPRVVAVQIGAIENRTPEPALNQRLIDALLLELPRRGVRVVTVGGAPVLEGKITELRFPGMGERGGVVAAFDVVLDGEFSLVAPDGTVTLVSVEGAYLESFAKEGGAGQLMLERHMAIDRALEALAARIAQELARP